MRLEYRTNKDGLYIIKKPDFDDIAYMILKEYQPVMLEEARPLDIEDLVCEYLYLDVKTAHLSKDGRILGVISFDDTTYEGFDDMGNPLEIDMPVGTILLDKSLMEDQRHIGRQRFTKTHEACHWILHRQCHVPLLGGRHYEFRTREDNRSIACRMDRIENPDRDLTKKWEFEEWEEWQADNLAAALLMPKPTFVPKAREIMRSYGIPDNEMLYWENDLSVSHRIVEEIKDIYKVSKMSVQLRMVRCDLLKKRNIY